MVEKNGLKFSLVRDETKAKAGKEAVCFYNVPAGSVLAGLTDDEKKLVVAAAEAEKLSAEQTSAFGKILKSYETLLGVDKCVEFIAARLDVAMRAAQLESGKDTLTMETKLSKALDYIVKGDFGRNRQGGIAGMATKLANAQGLAKRQNQLTKDMAMAGLAMATAKDDVSKAAAQQRMVELMGELEKLTAELNK